MSRDPSGVDMPAIRDCHRCLWQRLSPARWTLELEFKRLPGMLGIWSSDLSLLTPPPLTFGCLTQLGKLAGVKIMYIFHLNILH